MKRFLCILIIATLISALLSACQPTPEETIVAQKDSTSLEEKINESANIDPETTGVGSHYVYQKSYEQSKNTLTVDAILTGGAENAMPVLMIERALFESGESLQQIAEGLFPGFTMYNRTSLLKEEIQEEIDKYELYLFRVENNLYFETGEPSADGSDPNVNVGFPISKELQNLSDTELTKLSSSDIIESYIRQLYKDYEEAPSIEEMEAASYEIKVPDDSNMPQTNILAVKNDSKYAITFANGTDPEMSLFTVDRIDKIVPDNITLPEVLTPAPSGELSRSD